MDGIKSKSHKNVRKIGMVLGLVVLILGILAGSSVFIVARSNRHFTRRYYTINSQKITSRFRIVQLSDFHSAEYGEKNEELKESVEKAAPDLIVLTGDMINRDDRYYGVFIDLCEYLAKIAPTYMIYGNHECAFVYDNSMGLASIDSMLEQGHGNRDITALTNRKDSFRNAVEQTGVVVLQNSAAHVKIKDDVIDLYGVLTSDPTAFFPYNQKPYGQFLTENSERFKLLLCHEPYIFERQDISYWGDLVLCGHTHGGIMKFNKIGCLFESRAGWFPELTEKAGYIAGEYAIPGGKLIVSTGLANTGVSALRVHNPPEIGIIDIVCQ